MGNEQMANKPKAKSFGSIPFLKAKIHSKKQDLDKTYDLNTEDEIEESLANKKKAQSELKTP